MADNRRRAGQVAWRGRPGPRRGRHLPWLLLLPLLLHTGCVDDIVKQFIPVAPTDGEVPLPDAALAVDADGFDVEALTLTGISPHHGPFVGGTEVVLSGSGFRNPLTVRVGGKAVQEPQVTVLNPISVRIVTPAGEVGLADVEVERGGEVARLEQAFRYDPLQLDPASGPTSGGTLVTISGRSTSFEPGMTLTLGGAALEQVEVLSPTLLRAVTPPGTMGPADLTFSQQGSSTTVAEAFDYYQSADPKAGGMGGGPLAGTLTVTVLNWLTRAPVAGATVLLQKDRELQLSGTSDSAGVTVFTEPSLGGPISVTAASPGFEATTLVRFDARDVTIFLMPLIQPQPGSMPPGTQAGAVRGHVLFGGTTGAGSAQWTLVPKPKSGQQRRIVVYSTVPSISWGSPTPSAAATIDVADDGSTAWPFTLVGYTGALAIYAVAGLYTSASATFEPYAMGVTRGVLVGPGEMVRADIIVDTPLSEKVTLQLKQVPSGAAHHSFTLAVDLGADGLIILPQWEGAGDGVFSQRVISRLPGFGHKGLYDATLSLDIILEAATDDGLPLSRAIETSVTPTDGTLVVDGFVGGPVQLKPAPGGPLQGNTLAWSQSGAPHNLAVTLLRLPDETPVWRVVSPGAVTQVELPDPASFGLPSWPKGPLTWLQWLAHVPGLDFNAFTYSKLSSAYWDRWSFDQLELTVP